MHKEFNSSANYQDTAFKCEPPNKATNVWGAIHSMNDITTRLENLIERIQMENIPETATGIGEGFKNPMPIESLSSLLSNGADELHKIYAKALSQIEAIEEMLF